MKIVAAGCSFTKGPGTYVEWLQKHTEVIDAGSCAAGNAYIARAFLHHAYQDKNIIGICQWSGIHRQGFLTERTDIPEHDIAKGDYFDEDHAFNKNPVWVKTGGNSIQANNNSTIISKRFIQPYIKYFYNKEQHLVETAEAILRVYHYCELHKIRCYMMWWKPELIHYEFGRYSKPLWDMITNNNYITWLPSIGSWCIENAGLQENDLFKGAHPNPSHHFKYAEKVIWPYVCKESQSQ